MLPPRAPAPAYSTVWMGRLRCQLQRGQSAYQGQVRPYWVQIVRNTGRTAANKQLTPSLHVALPACGQANAMHGTTTRRCGCLKGAAGIAIPYEPIHAAAARPELQYISMRSSYGHGCASPSTCHDKHRGCPLEKPKPPLEPLIQHCRRHP
jgi:hypothetical protein